MVDCLYGNIELPDFLEELSATKEVQRLQSISQDVLPAKLMPWPMANRYDHSRGTAYLAGIAVDRNKDLSDYHKILIQVSALLHDTGNTALSHLGEPFLKMLNGKDGESFLEDVIHQSDVEIILKKLNVDPVDVVRCVTGVLRPLSSVVNGSIDVDNLDNVARYWHVWHQESLYDGKFIAASYRFDNEWKLDIDAKHQVELWQEARGKVYGLIYGEPHLPASCMIHRALGFAFDRGKVGEAFFRLKDEEALYHLVLASDKSEVLARAALDHRWYIGTTFTTENPTEKLWCRIEDGYDRLQLANDAAEALGIPQQFVCAYIGKGRDKRKIKLPFVDEKGSHTADEGIYLPIYRVALYLHPEYASHQQKAEDYLRTVGLI